MLGLCLYEMVTRTRLYTGTNLNQIVIQILKQPIPQLEGIFGRLIELLL